MQARILQIFLLLLVGSMLTAASCRNAGSSQMVPENLITRFQNGEISRCTFDGKPILQCKLNANDAGANIYDLEGNKLFDCNYGWGKPAPECGQIDGCQVLYRVKDNIWGLEPVDLLAEPIR